MKGFTFGAAVSSVVGPVLLSGVGVNSDPREPILLLGSAVGNAPLGSVPYPETPGLPAPRLRGDEANLTPEEFTAVIRQTCAACHNDQLMTANLSLQAFEVGNAPAQAEVAEKIIGNLQAEMMPPPGIPRPGGDTLLALAAALAEELDDHAATNPNLGNRPFQRLNRQESERAIHAQGFVGNVHRHVPRGWLRAMRFLVEELGADVNTRDHEGYTPLPFSSSWDRRTTTPVFPAETAPPGEKGASQALPGGLSYPSPFRLEDRHQ